MRFPHEVLKLSTRRGGEHNYGHASGSSYYLRLHLIHGALSAKLEFMSIFSRERLLTILSFALVAEQKFVLGAKSEVYVFYL